jgi:hypothetical protein
MFPPPDPLLHEDVRNLPVPHTLPPSQAGGRPVRAALRIGIAAVLLLGAVFVTLLATDLVDWKGRIDAGDTRFASGSVSTNLWEPHQLVPFGAARSLLGLQDDVAYREAVRAFVVGRPREQPYGDTDLLGARGHARELLEPIVDAPGDRSRRSEAANLIGVLGFANTAIDPDQAYSYLTESVRWFRRAIDLDAMNDDAKYNLELALSRLRNVKPPPNQKPPKGSKGGAGSGAGTGEPGSGY